MALPNVVEVLVAAQVSCCAVSSGVASLSAGGKPLAVLPGMSGQAEIRTGQRSVLSYLLRPWVKAREAFQER